MAPGYMKVTINVQGEMKSVELVEDEDPTVECALSAAGYNLSTWHAFMENRKVDSTRQLRDGDEIELLPKGGKNG